MTTRVTAICLLAPCWPLLGQALRVLPVVGFPGAEATTEISWDSPRAGVEATAIQWDILFPAQLLDLDGGGPVIGMEAERSGKTLTCSAPNAYSYACVLAGGQRPVGNGSIAVLRFKIRPDAHPGTSAFRIEKAQAVAADLGKIDLPDADATIVVRNPSAQAAPGGALADLGTASNANPVWMTMEPYLQEIQASRTYLDFQHARGMLASAQNALQAAEQAAAQGNSSSVPQAVSLSPSNSPALVAPAGAPPPEPATDGNGNTAADHNRIGREFLNRHALGEAIEELSASIRLDPGLAQAFNARGFAFYLRGEFARALQDLDEAIRLDSGYKNAYANRAVVRKAAGDLEGARADNTRAR